MSIRLPGGVSSVSPTFTGTVNVAGLTSSGVILIANGTNAAPSLGFASDADGSGTGFYRTGADTIGVTCGGARKFQIGTSAMTFDAYNIALDTGTGTKLGTATGQKLGFWGATPVVQQVLATGAGATVDNVITMLQTLGLCKQS